MWNQKINTILEKYGFKRVRSEYGLYVIRSAKLIMILALYVDDLLVSGNDETKIKELKAYLMSHFKMKDLILGNMKIIQTSSERNGVKLKYCISQNRVPWCSNKPLEKLRANCQS